MIAKKKQLIINMLCEFSLQASLQKHHLSSLTCLQVQVEYDWICKEKSLKNQLSNRFLFAGLFATHSN